VVLLARSLPGKPLGVEAGQFLGSIRFDGKPAGVPAAGVVAPRPKPAKRPPIGKVAREDATPEAAPRTFRLAGRAADEPTLREIALPNPELDWLLGGEPPPERGLRELRQRVQRMRITRLRSGDSVRMPGGDVHVIRPFEASPDRAAFLMDGIP